MSVVDIVIFAHNEEAGIGTLLEDLARQSILLHAHIKVRVHVLCNGCSDDTVARATEVVKSSKALSVIASVPNFAEGGKAKTWNRFVTEMPLDSVFVIFMDGDIHIPDTRTLENLLKDLETDGASAAATSRPRKSMAKLRRSPLLRFATSAIGRPHRDGPICGQLYIVRSSEVRCIRLPVPCLVEDGFLSACVITGLFSHEGVASRVKASSHAWHYFDPPTSFREFFQHDVRLALGVELNAALYSDLWAANSIEARLVLLRAFAQSDGIEQSIATHLSVPNRSALKRRNVFKVARGDRSEPLQRKFVRFPIRFAHGLYMEVVRRRARRLFRERCFQW